MDPVTMAMLASSAVKGIGGFLGASAQRKAQQKAYADQERELAEQQALELESLNKGLGFEQALANRGIGEQAAATGMSGSAIARRLGGINDMRKEALRKFVFSQMIQRKQLASERRRQEDAQRAEQKAKIYQGIGLIGGQALSNMGKQQLEQGGQADQPTTTIDWTTRKPNDYKLPYAPMSQQYKPTYSLRDNVIKPNITNSYYGSGRRYL